MFADHLHPYAGEKESGGRHPSIFTNVCAINYRANSMFEYQLNNNVVHNIQVTRQTPTLQLLRKDKSAEEDRIFFKKQSQEMKSIHFAKLQQECGTM